MVVMGKKRAFTCVFTELPIKKQQLHALNLLVLLLPEANRDTLKVHECKYRNNEEFLSFF